ncbi:MAG: hypothetical protein O2782_01240 [bacterium]|nr:hypothetical protein [bacterium]
MKRHLLIAAMVTFPWSARVGADDQAGYAPLRCGTGWLKAEHAAGRMQLPPEADIAAVIAAATGSAKRTQVSADIEVGTELFFPVSGSALIPATCQRVGEHAYVFVENRHWDTNGGSILQSHVDALGSLFDETSPADPARGVYELESATFGEPADVDGDPRIYLLVLNISSPNVVGYFDPAVAAYDVPEYRRDVLFIDETFLRRDNHLALGTLAHEFQHLIHWRWDADEDPWIDEGLSGYAEELVGYPEADPQAVPQFLENPHTSLTDWNFTDSARYYGVTYLFMSYLAERFGHGLIGELVAQPRNGTASVDAAFAALDLPDRFVDVWQRWMVANYASQDERYAYRALGDRRVVTFAVEGLPMQPATGAISGHWGTATILFRTPGDLVIDFAGDNTGRYEVWTYAMGAAGNDLSRVAVDAGNRGVAQLTGVDSAVVIIGRTSEQGQNFQLSARAFTPTVVGEALFALPVAASLSAAYPNPFNSSVRIPYAVATDGDADMTVYDLLGQPVRRLASGWHAPGRCEAIWDGRNHAGQPVASGTYLTRLHVAGSSRMITLSLIR